MQVIGFAGSSVALIAESVYQGIQGKLEGKISVEQTNSQSAYKDATTLINDVKDTIKSQANIATISAEYIRNNLAAKTATLNN